MLDFPFVLILVPVSLPWVSALLWGRFVDDPGLWLLGGPDPGDRVQVRLQFQIRGWKFAYFVILRGQRFRI